MDPHAKGMRYKTLPFLNAWREIFGKDRATGKRSANPFKDANDVRDEEIADTQECHGPNAEWNADVGIVGLDEDHPYSFDANVEYVTNSSTTAKRPGSTSSGKRKRRDVRNTRLASLTRVLESEFGQPEHRAMILEQVKELDSFDENEHIIVANRLVNHPKEMELFRAMSTYSRVKMARLMLSSRI
ncbi:UNVERIFIED_CONTAM: hypothetical protein Sindi_1420400 [Sesamum indicum]